MTTKDWDNVALEICVMFDGISWVTGVRAGGVMWAACLDRGCLTWWPQLRWIALRTVSDNTYCPGNGGGFP